MTAAPPCPVGVGVSVALLRAGVLLSSLCPRLTKVIGGSGLEMVSTAHGVARPAPAGGGAAARGGLLRRLGTRTLLVR